MSLFELERSDRQILCQLKRGLILFPVSKCEKKKSLHPERKTNLRARNEQDSYDASYKYTGEGRESAKYHFVRIEEERTVFTACVEQLRRVRCSR